MKIRRSSLSFPNRAHLTFCAVPEGLPRTAQAFKPGIGARMNRKSRRDDRKARKYLPGQKVGCALANLWVLFASAMLLSFVANVPAENALINVDTSRPGPPINPRMYGIFLEEINHGVDGGLYGELSRNRGFEDSRPPEGYTFRNGAWRDE